MRRQDGNRQPSLLSLEFVSPTTPQADPPWLLRFSETEKLSVYRLSLDSSTSQVDAASIQSLLNQRLLVKEKIVALVVTDPQQQVMPASLLPFLTIQPSLPVLFASPDVSDEHWYAFIQAAGALLEFHECLRAEVSVSRMMDWHRRYKMLFLAFSQPLYRRLGPIIAQLKADETFLSSLQDYREIVIELLKQQPTRENHTNALMHMQGYFRKTAALAERTKLTEAIHDYHAGRVPFASVILLFRELVRNWPHPWLQQQRYLYPRLPLRFLAQNLGSGEYD